MYRIKNESTKKILTIFATRIPNTETKIESLMKFFDMTVYNGKKLTEDSLFNHIKKSFKGKKILLEKIIETPTPKPFIKRGK